MFWFRSFHSRCAGSFHLSFTVLVHYWSPKHIFGLEGGSPVFKQWTFYCSIKKTSIIQDSHLLWCSIPKAFNMFFLWCHSRFLSPILTASRLICFPVATEMFQFTTCYSKCGFPRWEFCTFQKGFSDTTFRIVKRPYVLWSQGIHKTPCCSQRWTWTIDRRIMNPVL